MHTSQLVTLLAAALGLASSVQAAPPSTSGTKFVIDGKTGYFAGSNCYWCSFLTNPADIDLTLSHVASSGLKILRVWGFNDVTSNPGSGTVWYQHLSASGSTINTGANGLQILDRVVQAAEEHGVKLIIPFVNYWTDYGGVKAYLAAFGGSKESDWYTNEAAQAQYRKYVTAVVNRYRDSDAIFSWELMNEPRCPGCNTDVIDQWAASTSKFIKGLDPNHMVSLGDEGFGIAGGTSYPYQYGEGTDFVKHLAIDTLDFATFHLYPTSWGESFDFGNDWIKAHAKACAAAGKPCLFEEYGAGQDHCTLQVPWQKTSLAAEGMGGDAFWQWGEQNLSIGASHDDSHAIYYGSSDWECLVRDHVAAIGNS
ncbi:Glycoside Hydrolase Family protein [Fusarium albosuccineum]|uniref:Mannan endo-1,4-beta-mannosidase A n=1 Tax=Fusarium albosuccineum TaxID=1237068 RepID=A0A8H4LJV4_9HYPO|nr:Glycoside Hydrolase Family protein [Fusarium albosuccineum]